MPPVSSRMFRVKLFVVFAAVSFGLIVFFGISAKIEKVTAASSGPSPSHTNAPGEDNCTACHTSFAVNSGVGGVTIAGIPANYLPNQSIAVTVTTSQAEAVLYGFQLTAIDSQGNQIGTFTLPGGANPQMQTKTGLVGGLQRIYAEHTSNGISPTQFGSKSWTFNWQAPGQRVGKISFYAAGNAANSDGRTSGDYIFTTSTATLSGTAISNFDGDTMSDVAIYRPSDGTWYSIDSITGNSRAYVLGAAGDKPAAGDYDGDGKTDYAVYRPSNGTWYLQRSTAGYATVSFGAADDKPVPGDYDGDGKTDIAVYRPSTGFWYISGSSAGYLTFRFEVPGDTDVPRNYDDASKRDKAVPGDYDGDGKTDYAVYRPSNGTWYLQRSTAGYAAVRLGAVKDKPVPGDYDGDGKTDIAVYRPSTSVWYERNSTTGSATVSFGNSADTPVPADYDGDGKTDIAVYRGGLWYARKSTDGTLFTSSLGTANDIPVPTNYLP